MKRKILFRGKRTDNGEWIYGYLIGNNVIVGEVVDFDDDYFSTEFWYKVVPETVGQFTGLTDKNGTKVFEGGIIKAPSGRLYVVIWSTWIHDEKRNKFLTDRYEFTGWCISKDGVNPLDTLDSETLEGEVIGNIYDNPELLTQ